MFGNSREADGMQRENTPMHPTSPYGCAKLFSYSLVRNYRKAFSIFASNGILFNHESPRRATNFVMSKVIKIAVQIKRGKMKTLELGNLDSQRDWGHAKDYVRAMHLILNHEKADDFIISTGEAHSIRDLCKLVFSKLGMNYEEYVKINPKYLRPEELDYLCGDSSKARKTLGWKPKYSFEMIVEEMLEYFLKII
jgi:GDPmannose 4,6-dehydratase